ncbi:class I SAM-dependent methyltransferase [bacterium]|nr:class I SAM-dependent methyltransferase [bacterium]
MIEHFYNDIEGWFGFKDLYDLVLNKKPNGSHFVEIGCWKGKSSSYMATEIANSGKSIQFDCVDIWEGGEEHFDPTSPTFEPNLVSNPKYLYELFLNNMKPVKGYFQSYKGYSLEIVKQYKDKTLDFIFIDASHDYDNVFADITEWYKKLKPNGIIAGDDYSWCDGVKNAVHDYFIPLNLKIQNTNGCWIVDTDV